MSLFITAGAAIGLGIVLIVRGLAPPRTDLAVALGRWQVARQHSSRRAALTTPGPRERLGRWLGDRLAGRGTQIPARLRRDLAITGRGLEAHLAGLAITAIVGLLIPPTVSVAAALAGIHLGLVTPAIGSIITAAVLVILASRAVRTEASARRDELRRAVGTYLDLVSMSLAGGRGVTEALPAAASIGSGWAFGTLAQTVSAARRRGITPWDALGELGDQYGIQELTDLASALALVGDSGARIRQSLGARAGTMRRRQLADARADADKRDDDMRLTQVIIAFGFLIFIGYPAAMNILAA